MTQFTLILTCGVSKQSEKRSNEYFSELASAKKSVKLLPRLAKSIRGRDFFPFIFFINRLIWQSDDEKNSITNATDVAIYLVSLHLIMDKMFYMSYMFYMFYMFEDDKQMKISQPINPSRKIIMKNKHKFFRRHSNKNYRRLYFLFSIVRCLLNHLWYAQANNFYVEIFWQTIRSLK